MVTCPTGREGGYRLQAREVRLGIREEREREREESRAGLELCHTAEQEVLDGNTLPSCEHSILYSASHHMTHVTSITPDNVLRASSFMLKERPFKLAS